MQHGDLATSTRPRYVIVLEGVLCSAIPITEKKRFRDEKITGYHINWHEVPLKRAIAMKHQYPDNSLDLVTFIGESFLDDAVDFLNAAQVPFDSTTYMPLERFLSTLRFQPGLLAVYDSDPGRLDRYGQKGHAVQLGRDF